MGRSTKILLAMACAALVAFSAGSPRVPMI